MANIDSLDPIFKKRIKYIDSKHLDLDQRANLVNTFFFTALGLEKESDMVEQPLYNDLVAYSLGMLRTFALAIEDETLVELMKLVNNHIYSLYYSLPDNHSALGPEKEEHEKLWRERFEMF